MIFYSYFLAFIVIDGCLIACWLFWSKARERKIEHDDVLVLREQDRV